MINKDSHLRKLCVDGLLKWFAKVHHHEAPGREKVDDPELFERVRNALKDGGDSMSLSALEALERKTIASGSRTQPKVEQHEWTEAKSPSEWQKVFGISGTTWRTWNREKKLIVDKITMKKVRIRKDTLPNADLTK